MAKRTREQGAPSADDTEHDEVESPKKLRVDDNVTPTEGNVGGSYNKEEDAWEWDVEPNVKLRLSKFKGQPRVDIRYLSHGHYTKKGISLTLKTFEAIRSWDKYEEALQAINAKKN